MKSIQIKTNYESDDHISDLQDSILVQELTTLDMMVSKCSKNDTSSRVKENIQHKMLLRKRMWIVCEMLMDIRFLLMSYVDCQKLNKIVHT